VLEAERGFQGCRDTHREGSQTLRMGLPKRRVKRVGRFLKEGVKRRVLRSGNAEGERSSREVL